MSRSALAWPWRPFFAGCIVICGGLIACGAPPAPEEVFIERAHELGLDFKHENGMSGKLYFSEAVGSGVALLDFDNDGDLDLYVVQGGPLQERLDPAANATADRPASPPQTDRLFRNELSAGHDGPTLQFVDVTEAAGLKGDCYGMGATVGDVNQDGYPDIYVTCFGGNQLWLNHGDGTFSNVIETSGADDDRWTTSAAFIDVNGDGRLDLYLVSYTDFRLWNHKACVDSQGAPDYCGPRTYQPESDRLLINQTAGTSVSFLDMSDSLGLSAKAEAGLGVVILDADGDGRQDIYVANDQAPNHLWMSRGGPGEPKFDEQALLRGVAVDALGRTQASMGVDAGDVDGDDDLDLFMTHLAGESNTLYLNDGSGLFLDQSTASGLASDSIPMTGFGTGLVDVDNDGWLDVVAINGEVRLIPAQKAEGFEPALRQPNQLFRNQGGKFTDWTDSAPALQRPDVSRGLAVGDLDNDGDSDLVLSNNNGPLEVLLNQLGSRSHWIGLKLLTPEGGVALGAEVRLFRADQPVLRRTVRRSLGYLSSSDPRLLFGLGSDPGFDRIEIRWPDGTAEEVSDLGADQYHVIRQQIPQVEP